MDSELLLDQFICLWELLQPISLSTQSDSVRWSLMADGSYSATSAYDAQFLARIDWPLLHKTCEPKVKFYMWLLLQNRNWTTDRLHIRGWTHSECCVLCDQVVELAAHLTLGCSLAREVWHGFSRSDADASSHASNTTSISDWWRKTLGLGSQQVTRKQVTTATYVAWNLWKVRNRRTFEGKRCSPETVAAMARDEIALYWEVVT